MSDGLIGPSFCCVCGGEYGEHDEGCSAVQSKVQTKEQHYKYTVITRDNAAECDLHPGWWINHPEWNVLIRSNHKWPGRSTWICGGGATVEEAKRFLEESLQLLLFSADTTVFILDSETSVVMPVVLIGEESATVIKD